MSSERLESKGNVHFPQTSPLCRVLTLSAGVGKNENQGGSVRIPVTRTIKTAVFSASSSFSIQSSILSVRSVVLQEPHVLSSFHCSLSALYPKEYCVRSVLPFLSRGRAAQQTTYSPSGPSLTDTEF